MKKVTISVNNTVVQTAKFETQQDADAWLSMLQAKGWCGTMNYTSSTTDCTTEDAQKATNASSRAYLASTDWYVIRKQETGEDVPSDILTARSAARAAVVGN